MDERQTYTERQAAEIVRRAGELQMRGEESAPRGIDAQALRRMAEELGIEPRYIEQALTEGVKAPVGKYQLLSQREALVEGEPDFDLLGEMSANAGLRSTARQIGNTFIAHVMKGGGRHTVTLRKQRDKTRVAVETRAILPLLFGALGGFYTFLFTMAGLESANRPMPIWLPLALAAGCVFVASLIIRPWIARAHRAGDEVLQQYSKAVTQPSIRETLSEAGKTVDATAPSDQQQLSSGP